MRTCLEAALELRQAEQLPEPLRGGGGGSGGNCPDAAQQQQQQQQQPGGADAPSPWALLHCEGYCLYCAAVAASAMRAAHAAGALVSIDLASFEVVANCWQHLDALLQVGGGAREQRRRACGEAGGSAVTSRRPPPLPASSFSTPISLAFLYPPPSPPPTPPTPPPHPPSTPPPPPPPSLPPLPPPFHPTPLPPPQERLIDVVFCNEQEAVALCKVVVAAEAGGAAHDARRGPVCQPSALPCPAPLAGLMAS